MTHRPVPRVIALGPCPQCGLVHEYCKAHKSAKQTDGDPNVPCRFPAAPGLTVCRYHGGLSPTAIAAGQRRLAEERALGEVGALLAEAEAAIGDRTGVEHLEAGIRTAAAMAQGYRWLLEALPARSVAEEIPAEAAGDHDATTADGTVVRYHAGLAGPDHQGNLKLHPYEEGLHRWTKLHGELVKNAMVLGLEERKFALSNDLVDRFGSAVARLVTGLGRDLDDPEVVPVVEDALRVIAGDTPAGALEATAAEVPR